MTHFVGNTKNGRAVYVDLIASDAGRHIARQPYLLTLATELLRSIILDGPILNLEYDMKRTVGYDLVVETTAADIIFYVQLLQDSTYTRFTKNGKPHPTTYVSIDLRRNEKDESYQIRDIRIGRLAPARPGSADETDKSKAYWENHALVFENQPIQTRTLTKTRPY